MSSKTTPRPGGRSARVQLAVHQATQALLTEVGRSALTVPMIAGRAGVTPSTIYRRWGQLPELLADVALNELRAETEPLNTGTVLGDLLAWADQYLDEMSSEVGRAMLRDVLAARGEGEGSIPPQCQCAANVASQIAVIIERGVSREEVVPEIDAVMDGVVAPIIYRILFGPFETDAAHVESLVRSCVRQAEKAATV